MKLFFDTEFTGLHKDTTLISIGIIDETGRSFYAELEDYDQNQVNDWINENVISHLKYNKYSSKLEVDGDNLSMKGNKSYVSTCLNVWLSKYGEDKIQLVSDVAHYDMVLFIDLFGSAFDLPENVSPVVHDICQDIAVGNKISDFEAFDISRESLLDMVIEGDKHNSLYDAKVIRELYYKYH